MDETPNVNNLNGVPNFGHGLQEDITKDNPEKLNVTMEEDEKATEESTEEDVAGDGGEAQEGDDF